MQYYLTQFIGDLTNRPIIKVAPSFSGLGVISSNAYVHRGRRGILVLHQPEQLLPPDPQLCH
ncbi:hypothetical protein B0H67DRAFT_213214 [Lasiosphaeris hirsuta]|uniref:Uncharacterized protein n=1 Tax=Lasiosphaeris hirsuta TaxID=260670 RepID=A0AA40ASG3_9PEZI|nr:hypothetical protein B0H67DRAFT_213214 [Lasiosphaeris hirsuta]